MALDNLNIGVGFEPRDKIHPLASPPGKEVIIHIAPIQRDDASPWKIEVLRHGHVCAFAIGHIPQDRQPAIMVQQQMQFHRTLGLAPVSPVKHAGTQLDGGAVQGQQTILESEFLAGTNRLALGQQIIEQLLKQLPRPVGVGIGESRTLGFALQTQVLQFTLATLQTITDFPQRARLSQLAEKHGDKLRPTGKTSGVPLRFELADVPGEIRALKERQNLGKQTGSADHLRSPLMMGCGFNFTRISSKTEIFFSHFQNLIWTLVSGATKLLSRPARSTKSLVFHAEGNNWRP